MGQKFYQKVSVQVAMVGGVVAVIIAAGQIWSSHSDVKEENIEFSQANQGLRDDLATAKSEVQRLETLLTPFRTIALERYTGSEGEALRQLADQIGILQDADKQKAEKITQLESELKKTKSLATQDRYKQISLARRDRLVTSLKALLAQQTNPPRIILVGQQGNSARMRVANDLKGMLTAAGFSSDCQPAMTFWTGVPPDVSVICHPSNTEFVKQLVKVVAPNFIDEQFVGSESDKASETQVTIRINGEPLFSEEGVVSFR